MHTTLHENKSTEIDAQARRLLKQMLDIGLSTVKIERKLGVNRGLITYVMNGGHSPTMLKALGLPVHEKRKVVICMECGQIHTMHKSCAPTRRVQIRYRKCADLLSEEDGSILEHVAKINGRGSWTELCREIVGRYKKGHGRMEVEW